jgi:hypothetical protein
MTRPTQPTYWPLRTALAAGGVMASLLGAHLLAQPHQMQTADDSTASPATTVVDSQPVMVMAEPEIDVNHNQAVIQIDLPPIPTVASRPERTTTAVSEPALLPRPAPVDTSFTLNLAPVPTLAPPPPPPAAPAPQVVVTQSNSSR